MEYYKPSDLISTTEIPPPLHLSLQLNLYKQNENYLSNFITKIDDIIHIRSRLFTKNKIFKVNPNIYIQMILLFFNKKRENLISSPQKINMVQKIICAKIIIVNQILIKCQAISSHLGDAKKQSRNVYNY